jgi:hypothetical protein
MDRVITRDAIIDIVRREVAEVANVKGLDTDFYFTENPNQHFYSVVALPHESGALGFVPLAVRIDGDRVIIERDTQADPLYDTLREQGIPDEQIVLAYENDADRAHH